MRTAGESKPDGGTGLLVGNGTISNSGTITVNSAGVSSFTTLRVVGAVTLRGPGQMVLTDHPQNRITGVTGDHIINRAGHTLRGAGDIGVELRNSDFGSTVIADGVHPLALRKTLNTDLALLSATGTGGMHIFGHALNQEFGVIRVHPGSNLQVTQNLENLNGAVNVFAGAVATVGGEILNGQENSILIIDGVATANQLRNLGGMLSGRGIFNGRAFNSGTVAPTGTFTVSGDFQQFFGGLFGVNFDAPPGPFAEGGGGVTFDRLVVTGHAALAGGLEISFADGFIGLPGDQSTVLTFGTRSGDVDIVNNTPFAGLRFNKIYDATSLTIQFDALGGDANLDGIVNLADFNRLAANFGATGANWLMADFNGDGLVNLADFNILAANFGIAASGPEVTPADWAALTASVPEPATSVWLLSAAPLLRRRRRVELRL